MNEILKTAFDPKTEDIKEQNDQFLLQARMAEELSHRKSKNPDKKYSTEKVSGAEILRLTPEISTEKSSVFVVSGFGQKPDLLVDNVKPFIRDGRRVTIISPDTRSQSTDDILIQQGETIDDVIEFETEPQAKVIGIGYSNGARQVVEAALQRPDLFEQIILMAPAGMVGENTRFKGRRVTGLKGRFVGPTATKHQIRDTIANPRQATKQLVNVAEHIAKNPIDTLRDTKAMQDERLEEDIRKLKELNPNISIHVLGFNSDPVFPAYRIDPVSESLVAEDQISYSQLSVKSAGHTTPQISEIPFEAVLKIINNPKENITSQGLDDYYYDGARNVWINRKTGEDAPKNPEGWNENTHGQRARSNISEYEQLPPILWGTFPTEDQKEVS